MSTQQSLSTATAPRRSPAPQPDPALAHPAFGPPSAPDPLNALIDRVAKAVANELEQRERVRAIATEVIRQMDERAEGPGAQGAETPTNTAGAPGQEDTDG